MSSGIISVDENDSLFNITQFLESVDDIDKSVDYPNFLEYRVGESTITLNDIDDPNHPLGGGRPFDPQTFPNIFTRIITPIFDYTGSVPPDEMMMFESSVKSYINENYHTGYRTPIIIRAGFVDENGDDQTDDVFTGEILSVDRDVGTQTVTIECVDTPRNIREDIITDFGILKSVRLAGNQGSSNGEYNLPLDISPPSEQSVNAEYVNTIAGTDTLAITPSIKSEGNISENKASVSNDKIVVEKGRAGGVIDERLEDLFVTLKAPYRNKSVTKIADDLLQHYDVHDLFDPNSRAVFELPILYNTENASYFSSNGRPGYDIESETDTGVYNAGDPSEPWRWSGYVTDFIKDNDTDTFYLLYSSRQTFTTTSRIIKYTVETDTYEVLYDASGLNREFWSISSDDFQDFYVLGTEYTNPSSELGRYDSSEVAFSGDPRIWLYNSTYTEGIIFVGNNDTHAPQLAQHYHLGFGRPGQLDRNRLGSLPFSKKLEIHEGNLYYLWAKTIVLNSNTISQFGVARKPLSSGNSEFMFRATRDDYGDSIRFNSAGCSYTLDKGLGRLYGAFNFIKINASTPNTSSFEVRTRSI